MRPSSTHPVTEGPLTSYQPATLAEPASDLGHSLLERVAKLRDCIESHALQSEKDRALADEIYDAMLDEGLFRTLVPRYYGGMELHPIEAYRVWEALAQIDSAAGWNLQISSAISGFVSWLPLEGSDEIFAGGPDVILAGALAPPGPSVRVDDGWRITARVSFASGCHRAHWLAVPIIEVDDESSKFDPRTEDPPSLIAFIPRDEVDLVDTWRTSGMRATFSSDVIVDDVFVPDARVGLIARTCQRGVAFEGPLYGTMPWPGIHGETIVSLGIAQAAIEKLNDLANRKTPNYSRTVLRDRHMAQHHIAKASALVDASRVYLQASISDGYSDSAEHGFISNEAVKRCQLAACFGAEACAEAVDLVHEAAGTSGIREEQGFERHFRDIHTLTQHASKSYARYEDVGKMMYDLSPESFQLKL